MQIIEDSRVKEKLYVVRIASEARQIIKQNLKP